MKTEYLEKEIKRYVIATLTEQTQYLISNHFGKWSFTDNIQLATKTKNKELANDLKNYFYNDTQLFDVDLVVVPLRIDYVLLDETNE